MPTAYDLEVQIISHVVAGAGFEQTWAKPTFDRPLGLAATDGRSAAETPGHHGALRQLANRLVGILHGCLKTHTLYDETTAWAHHSSAAA